VQTGLRRFFRREAGRREDNLPVERHFSKVRTLHIADLIKRGQFGQAAGEGPAGYAGGAPPGTAGGYPPNVAGTKGPNAGATAPLKRRPGAPKNIYTVRIYDQNSRSASVDVEATTQKKAFGIVRQQLPGYRAYQIERIQKPQVQSTFFDGMFWRLYCAPPTFLASYRLYGACGV
jgi:hypothetical protein